MYNLVICYNVSIPFSDTVSFVSSVFKMKILASYSFLFLARLPLFIVFPRAFVSITKT